MKAKYDITGMNCAACSAAVERAMRKLGIDNVSVNLISGVMNIEYDENLITDTEIRKAITDSGFSIDKAKSADEKRRILRENAKKNEKSLLTRLILSVILMIILMYFSMGHMIGLPLHHILAKPHVLSAIQLILTIPILIINKLYFIGGFRHLFRRTPNMDSLIAIGSASAVIYGIFAIIKIYLGDIHYIHDLYFETAAMIPTLVTIGKYLEGKSRSGTGKALDLLIDLTPKKAIVLRGDNEMEIAIEELLENDTVIVKPGQSHPCDGTVISGESYTDESSLTGESIPVFKTYGDKVSAGTINKNGTLKIKAEKVGDETVISGIIRLVEEASGSKAPISRLADRISAVFVPIVILISAITFILWFLFGNLGFEFAFSRAICVLVISCPCALGLATPLAVTVGTGVAAAKGILIKNAETLEELGRINTVLFDKTGTLTEGTPKVCDILPSGLQENDFLRICATAEKSSEHPLGESIVKFANERNLTLSECESFEAISGKGLRAVINGVCYYGGNLSFIESLGVCVDNNIKNLYNKLCKEGKTPLFFATESEYLGCIAVSDKPKPDSKKAIEKLKNLGIKSVMITGDNELTAHAIAGEIGISEVCASVSPSQKEEIVRQFKTFGKVAMCGDGINDSPALARANVGISVSKGTDIAIETSDVILTNSDVYSVPKAISLSRATIKNIKLSLFWALLYNSLGIPIAAGVLYPIAGIIMNPMIGALAMSLSSICVVLNALRLNSFKFN